MFCKNCGNELKEGAMFCTKCGERISVEANQVEEKTIKEEMILEDEKTVAFTPEQLENEEKKIKILRFTREAVPAYLVKLTDNEKIPIDNPEFSLGKGKDASFKINNVSVSSVHAIISWVNGVYYVRDNASTNGTKVNDVLITNESLALNADDRIQIANEVFTFKFGTISDVPQQNENRQVGANVCPNCGAVNKTKSKFCVKCGQVLSFSGIKEPMANPNVQNAYGESNFHQDMNKVNVEKKLSTAKILCLISSILGDISGIIFILVGIFTLVGGISANSYYSQYSSYSPGGVAVATGIILLVIGVLVLAMAIWNLITFLKGNMIIQKYQSLTTPIIFLIANILFGQILGIIGAALLVSATNSLNVKSNNSGI